MTLSPDLIDSLGGELHAALRGRAMLAPLTETHAGIDIDDAYAISLALLARRHADGERVIGKKIGVTSRAVQDMLGVHQPDFGYLTDAMLVPEGVPVPLSTQLIQPRAEGEIAFVLKRDLQGPGVSVADVIAATDCVLPAIEVVDSRIRDWKIKIQDTVADNASCGLFVLGNQPAKLERLDLTTCGMTVEKNGVLVATGAGAAALGSPLNCVAWLANTLGRYGIALKAGEVVLSGSLVPLIPVAAGDSVSIRIGGIGALAAAFA